MKSSVKDGIDSLRLWHQTARQFLTTAQKVFLF